MRAIKLILAYDGTAYAGWQSQPDRPTLQETLETAIRQITGESVRALASGRTDAGVHALGQVAAFRTHSKLVPDELCRALNAVLPRDVAVLDVAEVDARFHPIRDARRKRYRYTIHDGPTRDVFCRAYCWHFGRALDAESMHRAAQSLLGSHDFSSFETSGAPRKTSVRTISDIFVRRLRDCPVFRPTNAAMPADADRNAGLSSCRPSRDHFIILEVEADGFLYNMVRAIAGTLVEVGRGAERESWVRDVLESADRRRAGPTAPPEGLCLVQVDYA
ncbi:MAG: tRNA pseudouridine(38-40) synthase TruA [Pirellulales bacterium]|nr:tRNA pseudouridine(38-40) synthase TruA [Pirellulales bacterium]